jgi:glycerol kinase
MWYSMSEKYVLALDSGTIKNRAVIFNSKGEMVSYAEKKISVNKPHKGWVEQDPDEIWSTQLWTAKEAIQLAKISHRDIAGIGVTNQRETTIVWNKNTGRPIYPAISWESQQTEGICKRLVNAGLQEEIKQKTSLVINPYFSATKLCWILENVLGAKEMAENGELLFGTVDTWLMWKLSGGEIFATDYSNASRTMMFNLRNLDWDDDILEHLGIPRRMLPEVCPSSHVYGETDAAVIGSRIPIAGCIGNQQADLFGEACFKKGMAKNTYGEGSFFLMNAGKKYHSSKNGLITTIAWGIGKEITYALEGSVLVSGATLKWVKEGLGLIDSLSDSEWLAKQVPDADGVYFVPAFRGLSAPYWDMETSGMIIGINEDTQRAHIVRAALEALAYQVRDVYEAITSDTGMDIKSLHVDGGASQNHALMQFQADLLNIPVIRPYVAETTALGAAFMAGLATGVWESVDELKKLWREGMRFKPAMSERGRAALYDGWQEAVSRVMGWPNK